VDGTPDWQQRTVSLPLLANGDRQHRTVVDLHTGKSAVTHLTIIERFGKCCLLQAVPETGRTHQIRAHLAALGLYIIGDKLYTRRADQQEKDNVSQIDPSVGSGVTMALHAQSIELSHPLSGQRLKFTAPYPPELAALLERMRKSSVIG
jgi:23S rRNA-/tRNA-specific pseudouridylate synthase